MRRPSVVPGVPRLAPPIGPWLAALIVGLAGALGAQSRPGPTGSWTRGPLRLVLTDSSFVALLGNQLGAAGVVEWRGDSLLVADTSGTRACPRTARGAYLATLRRDSLRFLTLSETCSGRRGVFSGGTFSRRTQGTVLLEDVTLIDGTGAPAMPHVSVLVREGLVAAIYPAGSRPTPDGAEVLPLANRWVIPGLMDAHVHLATDPSGSDRRSTIVPRLRAMLRGGVTSVRDMAGDARALADLARSTLVGDLEGPDIHYSAIWAGPDFMADPRVAASTRGARPGEQPWMRAVNVATDWRLAAVEARASGARGIKLYADADAAVARATVPAAHAVGLRVWAHATLFPARPSELVDAGVDVLSHAPLLAWEGADTLPNYRARYAAPYARVPPDAAALTRLLARMAARGTMLEPTLFVFREDGRNAGMAEWARAITGRAAAAGVSIVAGTDNMIATEGDSLPHLHDELELLVAAGLTPLQAIQAATSTAARAIGIDERTGTVRAGLSADLVVLDADPLADIRHTRRIQLVLKHGVPVRR